MTGQLFSIVIFSRIIKYLINKKKNIIFSLLTGFITGSLMYIWPWKKNIEISESTGMRIVDYLSYPDFKSREDIYLVLIILLGVISIIFIEKWAKNQKNV